MYFYVHGSTVMGEYGYPVTECESEQEAEKLSNNLNRLMEEIIEAARDCSAQKYSDKQTWIN